MPCDTPHAAFRRLSSGARIDMASMAVVDARREPAHSGITTPSRESSASPPSPRSTNMRYVAAVTILESDLRATATAPPSAGQPPYESSGSARIPPLPSVRLHATRTGPRKDMSATKSWTLLLATWPVERSSTSWIAARELDSFACSVSA